MTLPLIAFLIAAVIPVFFGKIRSAPFWLSVQALALGWNVVALSPTLSGHTLTALAEVLLVRAAVAPALLRRAIRARAEPNLDLMPSNLFAWAIAVGLIALAFQFGAPTMGDRQALTLGAVGATVAVALLLLSTNRAPSAQLVAVLFMENALALFESLLPVPWPLPVHGALSLIYLATVGVGGWLIATPDMADATNLPNDPNVDPHAEAQS
jgi:hydrogenase-4 membrane subunit HyfE